MSYARIDYVPVICTHRLFNYSTSESKVELEVDLTHLVYRCFGSLIREDSGTGVFSRFLNRPIFTVLPIHTLSHCPAFQDVRVRTQTRLQKPKIFYIYNTPLQNLMSYITYIQQFENEDVFNMHAMCIRVGTMDSGSGSLSLLKRYILH